MNGSAQDCCEWLRNMNLVQEVFRQAVEGYARLLEAGYYHCNICLESMGIQIQPNRQNPAIPAITVKLMDFEQAVEASSNRVIAARDGNMKGGTSFIAPEVTGGEWSEL